MSVASGPQYFSVPIFFCLLRETLESVIVTSVLLSLVEGLVDTPDAVLDGVNGEDEATRAERNKKIVKRMRLQIWAGVASGLLVAICIGAAFIAVFFTTLNSLWAKSEELWEGCFCLIASFMMGLSMLKIDRSKVLWRRKLQKAFDETVSSPLHGRDAKEGRSGKWTLFLLPFVTILREGLEAVVFVSGVALGQSAKSIPIAALTGLGAGLLVGYVMYKSSNRLNLTIFLVISTNILFLLGAGLFSRSVGDFERYKYNTGIGGDATSIGSGPGSYDVHGNVWHLAYGDPQDLNNGGWGVFYSILGWSNNASYGTILSYAFYWIAVAVALMYMKWKEGRSSFFGIVSEEGKRRRERKEKREAEGEGEKEDEIDGNSAGGETRAVEK